LLAINHLAKELTLTLITLAGLIVTSPAAAVVLDDKVNPHYKGGSSFNLAGAGPNVARCGAFPENVELSFTGAGTDTEGGYNTAVFSACTNTTTNEVFDLKATDTYAGSGDSVFIEGDRFVLAPNRPSAPPRTLTASPSASRAARGSMPAPPAPATSTSPAT